MCGDFNVYFWSNGYLPYCKILIIRPVLLFKRFSCWANFKVGFIIWGDTVFGRSSPS